MHPVTMLMEEIYHDYWGISDDRQARHHRRDERARWLRTRQPRRARPDGDI